MVTALITGVVSLIGVGVTFWLNRKTAVNTPAQKTNAIAARDESIRTSAEAALQAKDDSTFEKGISE